MAEGVPRPVKSIGQRAKNQEPRGEALTEGQKTNDKNGRKQPRQNSALMKARLEVASEDAGNTEEARLEKASENVCSTT